VVSDEQAITDTIARWLTASKEGDLQTLADILDDHMLFTVSGRAPFGKKEFLGGGTGKPYLFDAKASVLEVVVNGDWALTRVQLEIEFAATENLKVVRMAGPTMTVWRRAPGDCWQIWRDANMVAPTR
jgi:uncharacterized protein (TIGR02246 family)